ncbi:hypothetical protein [Natronorubrum aibiense]|uniref:hypothetical protein n=1 Tax=Natronorubrum aibiense TaxID=348826 RepID=UPI00128F22DD|nr:hypothetical protein [Natronorubrum aibiense]
MVCSISQPTAGDKVDHLELLEDPPAILRDSCCTGALTDETLEDPETLREAFIE